MLTLEYGEECAHFEIRGAMCPLVIYVPSEICAMNRLTRGDVSDATDMCEDRRRLVRSFAFMYLQNQMRLVRLLTRLVCSEGRGFSHVGFLDNSLIQ